MIPAARKAFCLLLSLLLHCTHAQSASEDGPDRATVVAAMREATDYLFEHVSERGGFVWYYLPDLSRRWGEIEARPGMIWIQPPGTATVGHVLLDAWYATGDDYFHGAASKVADALIAAQHPAGGWNYLHDFDGEADLIDWYETVGANAWRLEEFQHYTGNATFDDGGTYEATLFLLRMVEARGEAPYRKGLERALDFVLDSQYPNGGWPQRYPLVSEGPLAYSSDITFNDDVALGNIRLLLMAYRLLGEQRLLDAALRGMDAVLLLQLPAPQPGWALQYTLDLKPGQGRSYEPAAVSAAATRGNVRALMAFYRLTGQARFIQRVPEAIRWLESLALPPAEVRDGRTHPRVVEQGTDKTLYIYRRGSNVENGEYYFSYEPGETVIHYPSTGHVDTDELWREYRTLGKPDLSLALPQRIDAEAMLGLPRYYISPRTLGRIKGSNVRLEDSPLSPADALAILQQRKARAYWPTLITRRTHPYSGAGSAEAAEGDYAATWVGDDSDTSPYFVDEAMEVIGIDAYVANMARLLRFVQSLR